MIKNKIIHQKVHPWKKIIQDEEGNNSEKQKPSGKTVHLATVFFLLFKNLLELAPENPLKQEKKSVDEMRKPGAKKKTETGGILAYYLHRNKNLDRNIHCREH